MNKFNDYFLSDEELILVFGILKDLSIDHLTSKGILGKYLYDNGISIETIKNMGLSEALSLIG